MNRLFVITLILVSSCGSNKSRDLKQVIKEFDSHNATELNKLCKSLMENVGKNRSYLMVILPGNKQRFREIDSTGHLSNFVTDFVPSESQLNLLTKAGVSAFNYNKKARIFFARLTSYKSADQTIWVYIDYEHRKISTKKPVFFEEGNRKYILSKD